MSGDEQDYEYEESTVVVEIQGLMENDFLTNVSQARVLGIETGKPLLQLDDYTFTGEFQDTLGSAMLFEEKSCAEDSESNTPSTKVELCCTANKKWNVKRVFLKDNLEGQADSSSTTSAEQNSDISGIFQDKQGGGGKSKPVEVASSSSSPMDLCKADKT